MVDPAEGKEIKQDYLGILESLLQNIQKKANEKELEPNNKVSVFFGSRKVYEQVIGEKPSISKINAKQVSALNQAISEPQNLKGSIHIKVGQLKVFHVKDGEVITDKLGLTNLQNQASKITSKEQNYSVESLQKQVEVLQNQVQEQQTLIESLKQEPQTQETLVKLSTQVEDLFKSLDKQQKLIEQTQQGLTQISERQTPVPVNSKLQNWVGAVEAKVKQTSKNVLEQIKSAVTPEIVKLRSQMSRQVDELKTQVNQQFTSMKDEVSKKLDDLMLKADTAVNSAVYDVNHKIGNIQKEVVKTVNQGIKTIDDNIRATKGKAIESGVTAMLHLFGDRHENGTVTFESNNFDFQQVNNTVTVKAKDGRELLKDGILTLDALESDIESLEQIQPSVDEYLTSSQSEYQSQSQSRGLKR